MSKTIKRKFKTVGEASLKASADRSRYDPLELGYAMTEDVGLQVAQCAKRHEPIIDEVEYFIVLQRASDCMIKQVVRHKYYAYPFMPSPRPEQAVWLYNKKNEKIRFLWSLPSPKVMAVISEMPRVDARWQRTKAWCDAFYKKKFWEFIREQHKIKHLSEIEFLEANREKLVKMCSEDSAPLTSDTFDFSKVSINNVVDTQNSFPDQN